MQNCDDAIMHELESVAIRRGTERDGASLRAVHARALEVAFTESGPIRDWHSLLSSPLHFVYLAEDTRPFGFVCAGEPLEALPGYERHGEVIGWYVLPEYQGYGMGRKLLVRGLSVLKRRGFASALLWLRDDAAGALSIVESLGFDGGALSRTTNWQIGGEREVRETGYELRLDDWF